jgi:putative FmdB family regulatory protein
MPIYEYHCKDCGHNFEYLVMGGSEPDQCDTCKSANVCKLMSTCGFVTKGSGGETVSSSTSTSSCGGCAATSCAGCGST